MDGSTLQLLGLVAVVGAMIITLYEMRSALRPATCPECWHCRNVAEAHAQEQERLARDYAKQVGLPDEDDDRRIE
jgi:tartrate dehydratase alpha subunit/fumarate hydratase class I-like protein